jgi:O-succinylbenzoate synthase
MKIDLIELKLIVMRLKQPFETSFGITHNRPCILVKLELGDIDGWGEVVAGEGPWYSYEDIKTAWHVLTEYLATSVIGKDIGSPDELYTAMSHVRGHNMAKAGLEEAFWDAYCKFMKQPLYKALGGIRDRIESGVSIGITPTVNDLIRTVGSYIETGYKRIKIKIKPGWDVSVIKMVRDKYPDIPLQVDANAAYTLSDTPTLKKLEKFNLTMLEQPLGPEDLVDHATLQKMMRTPICLDESISSVDAARAALALGSCKVINIKPGRVGGLLASLRIHKLCEKSGIPVWIGGMLETGIGRAHNIALATLPNVKFPCDISASDRYYDEDVVDPPFVLNNDGTINLPLGDGIGVDVDEEKVARLTLKSVALRP